MKTKSLSPSQLVYNRFIRNRLAITGLIILLLMFAFSFLGSILSPYGQTEVFTDTGYVQLDFAVAAHSDEFRFTEASKGVFPESAQTGFLLAMATGKDRFGDNSNEFIIQPQGDNYYTIAVGSTTQNPASPSDFFPVHREQALASKLIIDAYDPAYLSRINTYDFRLAAETSLTLNKPSFEAESRTYSWKGNTILCENGLPLAEISHIAVSPIARDVFLPMDFKEAVRDAVTNEKLFFYLDGTRYDIHRINAMYYIKTASPTELIQLYKPPSAKHWLGTDPNGMDMLTRLMYGGRVSLTVGFVVIAIELLIGVAFGGISGYFGGWVDTLMMRFVELFNALPFLPLLLVLASVMDLLKVPPIQRLYYLMLLMGLLGWTGIARLVRGQIIALREQAFMMAAEAAGLRVSRRIFNHLIPNIMPLLIVTATMGLGSTILTEATLSFLGLGIKYPLATWGSIANNATNITTLMYYPWTWIPAGVLIFTTVLAFNFVGDGLRDAFDPKVSR